MSKKLRPGDAAPDVTLLNADGDEVDLKDLWANGPTLLTLLRHFG